MKILFQQWNIEKKIKSLRSILKIKQIFVKILKNNQKILHLLTQIQQLKMQKSPSTITMTSTLFIIFIAITNFNLTSANKITIECQYMTAMSYQESGILGVCDTADSHNTSDNLKYDSTIQFLSNTYICFVTNFPTIRSQNVRVQDTIGAYCPNMLHLDVKGIVFDCRFGDLQARSMDFMPFGLENFFPHLQFIKITHCGLTRITQSDLKPFEKLQKLELDGNLIETIDSDTFKFNLQLTVLNLASNEINRIDSDALSSLKLDYVDVTGNLCVRRQYANINETLRNVNEKCSNGGHSAGYYTFITVVWSIIGISLAYVTIIGGYVGLMRFKYQKKVKIEFFNELIDGWNSLYIHRLHPKMNVLMNILMMPMCCR